MLGALEQTLPGDVREALAQQQSGLDAMWTAMEQAPQFLVQQVSGKSLRIWISNTFPSNTHDALLETTF